jgi:transcriptional regulator with XRE-family HTH domain
MRTAALVGVDPVQSLRRFHPGAAPALGPEEGLDDSRIARWLTALRGSIPIVELARRAGRSRYSVTRWLSGKTRPRLPEFLELVDAITGRADDLVAELAGGEVVQSLAELHKQRLAAKELAFLEPWTEAITRIFETEAYRSLKRHEPGFVSSRLGIDLQTENRCIQSMLAAGLIRDESGRFVPGRSVSIDTGTSPDRVLGLKKHWVRSALARMEAPRNEDLFAYNAMSLSKKDLEAVRLLLQQTYREIRAIVGTTEAEETAALVQMQLIHWT